MRRPLGARQEDDETQINLTPMLDVVFIMLIFFIVTATFIQEVGLDLTPPDPSETPPPPDPDKVSIVVQIDQRDRFRIAQRFVDWRAVRPMIERLRAENPNAPVVVVPHADSTTNALIHVMDSARQAGIYDVQIGSIIN